MRRITVLIEQVNFLVNRPILFFVCGSIIDIHSSISTFTSLMLDKNIMVHND